MIKKLKRIPKTAAFKKVVVDKETNRVLEVLELEEDRILDYADIRENIEVLDAKDIDGDFSYINVGDKIINGKLHEVSLKFVYIYRLEKRFEFKGESRLINHRTFRFDDELTEKEKAELEEKSDMKIIEETDNSVDLGEIASGRVLPGDAYISDERNAFLKKANKILYGNERLPKKKI